PNLAKRPQPTSRRFAAFIVERQGKYFVQQRPASVVNAHLWEFPNAELNGRADERSAAQATLGFIPNSIQRLGTIKHSITRYRITLEALRVGMPLNAAADGPNRRWLTPVEMAKLPFPSAHKKIVSWIQLGQKKSKQAEFFNRR